MKSINAIIDDLAERQLLDLACKHAVDHYCTVGELLSRRRMRDFAHARHALWAELYDRGHWSYPRLGELFGVNHTTVMEGVRQHRIREGVAA